MQEIKMVGRAEGSRRSLPRIAVLHIPHSSRQVLAEERGTIRLADRELDFELLRMTDAWTDLLFPSTPVEAARLVFPVSRLVCDVERFPSDADEPMAARGMGAIYTRTSSGDVLRVSPDGAGRDRLLARWYRPHHSTLERMVNDVVARSGICLVVDCHSFPSVALPYELDQTSERAGICIGTDAFHTPARLREALVEAAAKEGYSVAVDAPFAGALVPLSTYCRDRRVMSVMIEVNRRLYMDEQPGAKTEDFAPVRAALGRLIMATADAAVISSAAHDD
jgi:N-formylglutamate amidohydrolase